MNLNCNMIYLKLKLFNLDTNSKCIECIECNECNECIEYLKCVDDKVWAPKHCEPFLN